MKRSVKSLLLLCVLLVCVGGYIALSHQQTETQTVTETSGTFALTDKTAAEITAIRWEKDDVSYDFTLDSDTWYRTGDPEFPVNQSELFSLAEELASLQATRKVEDVKSASDYGLESPGFSVTAAWSDGTETVYAEGNATPFEDGYYLSLSGDTSTIYIVASALSSSFNLKLTDLAEEETLPEVTDVTRLTLTGGIDVTYQEESLTIDPDQHWYDTTTNTALTDSSMTSMVNAVKNLSWYSLVAATTTEEDLATYGLTDADARQLVLYNGQEAVLTLLLGNDNGSSALYARLPGSQMVYTVSSSSLSSLLSASVDSLWSKNLLNLSYDQLQEATMTSGSITKTLTGPAAVEEAATDETADTTESTDSTGDEAATNEADESLWQAIAALTATDTIASGDTLGDAMLTIQATSQSGQTATLTIYEYSVDSYAATLGDRTVLISADAVDKIVRMMKQNP